MSYYYQQKLKKKEQECQALLSKDYNEMSYQEINEIYTTIRYFYEEVATLIKKKKNHENLSDMKSLLDRLEVLFFISNSLYMHSEIQRLSLEAPLAEFLVFEQMRVHYNHANYTTDRVAFVQHMLQLDRSEFHSYIHSFFFS